MRINVGELKKEVRYYHNIANKIKEEVSKIVVGQKNIINGLLCGLFSGGHVLVEGVPGTAKTLIIKTLAKCTGCTYSRIQFTVDLLPTDITGITAYDPVKGFYTIKGPIFANFVLADEINRAPAKTQSALLEAMQEKQVTIGKKTYKLEEPFFVMATQNPIESAGTYPLPQAQVDRFLLKLMITYPKPAEEEEILTRNTTLTKFEEFDIKPITSSKQIIAIQECVKSIYMKPEIKRYIVDIISATRYPNKFGISLGKYIEWGASPRASIGLYITSKADALLRNNYFVTPQNVKNVAYDALRHKIILNYEGQAEKITTDEIIEEVLSKIPVP